MSFYKSSCITVSSVFPLVKCAHREKGVLPMPMYLGVRAASMNARMDDMAERRLHQQ